LEEIIKQVGWPGRTLVGADASLAAFLIIQHAISRPDVQLKFMRLTGDLPGRVEAWRDSSLTRDPNLRAFGAQLEHVVPTPKVPEWEQIAIRVQDQVERVVRRAATSDSALADLSKDVDRMLEKRRWLRERALPAGGSR
jgi:multiple sugar transport system substrate-binding protein